MIVLGLDTTGGYCSAALVNDHSVLASIRDNIGRGHAEYLAPMIERLMAQAGLTPKDIDRISVCTGPGSFTGQRVALAFAKGFALPRNLPVIGISSLELWASIQDPEKSRSIISVADVRRGELCWAQYTNGKVVYTPVTQPGDEAWAEIRKLNSDFIIEDAPILAPHLAWLAMDRSEAENPAVPLYSRGPDAKLQGGISL